jgi:hypothetical protein
MIAQKRVAIYARVSTVDKGQAPETQLLAFRECAARRGFLCAGEYVEYASGRREDRPRYRALLAVARKWQVNVVSDNNLKGNADTERVMRPLKEACLRQQEWTCPFICASVLKTWIDDANEHYLHSALGYKPPRPFERDYHLSHGTQLPAA